MRVYSSTERHTLAVALPAARALGLSPEMVTVSAKRGSRLAVVADLWHLESDCECFFRFIYSSFSCIPSRLLNFVLEVYNTLY